jgi:hypothetical protein
MSMRPRASLFRAHILIAVVPMLLTASSLLLAQMSSAQQESPTRTLEELAGKKFGKLTPTEKRVVQAAASGEVAWGGEKIDESDGKTDAAYNKPSNDPANATEYDWRDRRSVRADLIRWLCEHGEARKLVDQHGIDIVGAWIDGVVDLSYLHTDFPVILWQCRIPNGIKMTWAKISDLELVGSWIGEDHTGAPGQEQKALNGAWLTVHGNVLLSQGFRAFGQVDLFGAKIDGQLYCTAGHFSDPGGNPSLRLRLASIGGEAKLDGGFSSDGVVDLVGAKINGDLLLDGADFSGPSENGLRARGLTAHALHWTHVGKSDQTELDLLNANVVMFEDDKKSRPAPGHLAIDGFVYGTLKGGANEAEDRRGANEAEDRLDWLNLQPLPHRPQPYKQLAKVFVDNGQDSDATEVLLAKEADLRQQFAVPATGWQKQHLLYIMNLITNLPLAFIRSVVLGTLKLTIDYGSQPLRALWWIAAFVAIGTYTFHWGYRMGLVIPTDREAYETFKDTSQPAPNYPPFNAVLYSIEAFVPLITFHQCDSWLPISGRHKGWGATFLRGYVSFHMIAGWTLFTLFAVSFAPDGPARLRALL